MPAARSLLPLTRSATERASVPSSTPIIFGDPIPRRRLPGRLLDGEIGPLQASPAQPLPAPPTTVLESPTSSVTEILTHTDPPLEDSVELFNAGAAPTSTSAAGSSATARRDNLKKYRIPDNTILVAGGHLVFTESQFNAGGPTSFTFDSARGDEAWLSAADPAGNLTGQRAGARFGAAENGVAFGRVVTSIGEDYAAALVRTPGQANGAPLVGPLVINEIMYNPVSSAEEFIEIQNISGTSVPFARVDAAFPTVTNTLRLVGGIDFSFPIASPQSSGIAAGEHLVIVGFNPADVAARAAFVARYNVPVNTRILRPVQPQPWQRR